MKFNNLDLQFRLNKRKPDVRDGSGIVNYNVKVKQKTNNHPNIGYGDAHFQAILIDGQESPYIEFLPGYINIFSIKRIHQIRDIELNFIEIMLRWGIMTD